ncbi:MAG: hypothetical protein V1692_00275 [bacterium]
MSNNIKEDNKPDHHKKRNNLFIIFIIIIILLLILLSRCQCRKNQGDNQLANNQNNNQNINTNQDINNNTDSNSNTNSGKKEDEYFPDLSGCINGILVDYHSRLTVTNKTEAGEIFKEYIAWAQANHQEIFYGKGNNWQFDKAEPHGLYQGLKYWRITGLWFSETKQEWVPQTVFDINQNSQVVRLLGCL